MWHFLLLPQQLASLLLYTYVVVVVCSYYVCSSCGFALHIAAAPLFVSLGRFNVACNMTMSMLSTKVLVLLSMMQSDASVVVCWFLLLLLLLQSLYVGFCCYCCLLALLVCAMKLLLSLVLWSSASFYVFMTRRWRGLLLQATKQRVLLLLVCKF